MCKQGRRTIVVAGHLTNFAYLRYIRSKFLFFPVLSIPVSLSCLAVGYSPPIKPKEKDYIHGRRTLHPMQHEAWPKGKLELYH
jgi:hypothetical protein